MRSSISLRLLLALLLVASPAALLAREADQARLAKLRDQLVESRAKLAVRRGAGSLHELEQQRARIRAAHTATNSGSQEAAAPGLNDTVSAVLAAAEALPYGPAKRPVVRRPPA